MRKVSFRLSLKWVIPFCLVVLVMVPTVVLAQSRGIVNVLGAPSAGNNSPVSAVVAATVYQPTWASVDTHPPAPEWFQDAKFGIYYHWGVYSVAAFGSEWYPRNMYNRDGNSGEYQHHMQVFGDPFGNWPYHNFINGANNKAGQWTQFAPKLVSAGGAFDPDAWAQLFVDAGAKFAGPASEHHDGFSMWDSNVNEWNSVDKGPRLDLARLFATSIRARGMKFFMSSHSAYNFTGYYGWVPAQSDPSLQKLYGKLSSTQEYQLWLDKLKEMIDGYQPDIMWHDFNLGQIPESYRLQYLAYYYNAAIDWNKEVVTTYKDGFNQRGEILDYERGGPAAITSYYWLTDDAISSSTWSYTQGMSYYSTTALTHALIDRVSKNGNMVLNISPMADGTIPSQQQTILRGMGDWLRRNGEAIYSTRAWNVCCEGPTQMGGGSGFQAPRAGNAQDFRYTRSKDNSVIYAIELGWPGNGATVTMTNLASGRISNPISVQLITGPGTYTNLSYQQTSTGLRVTMPSSQPFSALAYAFKVTLSGPQPERVSFYQDLNYGGSVGSLGTGTYTTAQLSAAGIPDNWASSVRVPAGYTVEIYDLDNLGGTRWAFTADNADFIAAGLNDMMSSVRITGTTPTTPPPTTPAGQAPYGGTPAAIPGTIQAENYDTGGEGVAYHDTTSGNSGNTYRTDGVDVETTTDSGGGYDVGYTEAGEWQEYTVSVATSGSYTLNARVASQSSGGTLHVEVDGVNVTGALAIPSTGGWQTWTTVTRTGVSLSAGQHVMRIAEDSAGFNVNWVSLTGGGTPPATTPPPTTPPVTTPPPGAVSINAGGSATGSFVADQYFSGGSTYTNTATIDMSQITANPPPAAVFSTERYGAMTYTIPNRSGAQTVTLYFAETYVTAAGQRVFNVSINGAAVLSNFDIYASSGGANRAIARTFSTTANASGQVVIQFTAVTENPKINGITVAGGSPTPTTPPPTTPAVTTPPPTTPPPGAVSINAGGSATGSFTADQYFSGGSTYTNTATIDMSQIPTNPPPAAIFNTERYGAMTYTIPNLTAGGTYTVTLYFAETYLTAAGQRLFNVSINGGSVLSSFDIYASAGGANRAIARSFTTTANSSGQVVIQFTAVTENPKINGITVAG
jgi:alpha-L-fucosidase